MAVGDDPSAEIELDHLYEELEEMDPSTFEVRAQRTSFACHVLTSTLRQRPVRSSTVSASRSR